MTNVTSHSGSAQVSVFVRLQSQSSTVLSKATEEDGSSDEDLDDDAMMELDKGLAALFSEQKKKVQAKKDEKSKLQKEKSLVRDFKIKVSRLLIPTWYQKLRGS